VNRRDDHDCAALGRRFRSIFAVLRRSFMARLTRVNNPARRDWQGGGQGSSGVLGKSFNSYNSGVLQSTQHAKSSVQTRCWSLRQHGHRKSLAAKTDVQTSSCGTDVPSPFILLSSFSVVWLCSRAVHPLPSAYGNKFGCAGSRKRRCGFATILPQMAGTLTALIRLRGDGQTATSPSLPQSG
jgi:hypothetical protein